MHNGVRHPGVLIVTNERAQEIDGVIDLLRARGAMVRRWNLCRYPETSATASDGRISFGTNGNTPAAEVGWLHDTGAYSSSGKLEGLARELSMRECDAFWSGALPLASRRWLSHPDAVASSSNKLRQLHLAKQLGVPFPPYIATNDPGAISAFRLEHPLAVVKAVRGGFVVHLDDEVKLVTKRIDALDEAFEEGLRFNPVIVQEEEHALIVPTASVTRILSCC
jgi:hypothetical protein